MNATVKPSTTEALQKVRDNVGGISSKVRSSMPDWLKQNQTTVIILAAAVLALAVMVYLIMNSNINMRPLYGRQESYDVAAVIETLDSTAIDYVIHPDSGQVLVNTADISRARMALATAGVVRKAPAGMEQLSAEGQLGRSQFVERAQYFSGLQGEIEQTIMSMRPVRSARVHLAVPERTAFLREQLKATAAVYLDLYPGATLDQKQVQGIINLVSGSLPNLDPAQVSVLDQNSNPLNGDASNGFDETDKQLEYTQRVEREYVQRVTRLLEPLVGAGNLRVAVNVDFDFSYQEESTEGFDPDSAVLRSESYTGNTDANGQAGGVPGVAANNGSGEGQPVADLSESRVRNFELDRTLRYRRQDAFVLNRVNVAVMLNSSVAGLDGDSSGDMLQAVNELLLNAAGIDQGRGDQVAVRALPFVESATTSSMGAVSGQMNSGNKWLYMLIGVAVFLLGGIAILVFWLRKRKEQKQKDEMAREIAMLAGEESVVQSGSGANGEYHSADRVRDLARSNPEQVAGILERWIKEGDQ